MKDNSERMIGRASSFILHPSAFQVDVLIPAYNAAATLPRAIRSLQAQTFSDWRAVIVDDGSTDGTAEVVRGFGDDRIQSIACPQNVGRGRARTRGVSECAAPYVAMLDADDWCLPERLQRLIAILEADADLAYAGSAAAVADTAGRVVSQRGPERDERYAAGWRWDAARLLHPTLAVRRAVFERVAYSPSRYAEDFVMTLRLTRHFAGCALAEALYVYEEGPSQTGWKYFQNSREVARVLWREPAPLASRARALAAIAAKVAFYSVAAAAGLQNSALKARSRPIDPATRERVEQLRNDLS